MRTLVVAEHAQGKLKGATLSAVGFARALDAGELEILLIGHQVGDLAEELSRYAPVRVADHETLKLPTADRYAEVIRQVAVQREASVVVAASSTYSKDILPRVAALLDGTMGTDIIGFDRDADGFIFRRPMNAGSVVATVRLLGEPKVLTVRAAAFEAPDPGETCGVSEVVVDADQLPSFLEVKSGQSQETGRPDITEARVVVSGGRGVKSAEDFERTIGALADALDGAVGCTRALVDAGITSNDLQVGQTGKIAAPELYFAVAISGTVQHLAGIKDSKIIIAINKDPDAPIFEVADYGLVGDLYRVVPELIEKLKAR
jgi:electron transfer flavoprotein alpha subunit